ncbi:hypothetical protein TNCT_378061 [Trichonephila clavata]|uniref:Uncharacterized protein n=1 Tax=Trichonephila clavata TaxID=2740835 RepID=A0A8X6H9R9_TRICU|nr:hypothetical protein TNCT_378061 [Trichonephila clavata]
MVSNGCEPESTVTEFFYEMTSMISNEKVVWNTDYFSTAVCKLFIWISLFLMTSQRSKKANWLNSSHIAKLADMVLAGGCSPKTSPTRSS